MVALQAACSWADDIKLGVAGPLTGANAAFGAQLQKGAEQAVADINAAGGINGSKFKSSSSATTCRIPSRVSRSPTSSWATASSIVVGHFNSGVSIPASEVYVENGILQITPASTNPKFTERGLWNTFRVLRS